jgi:hypothetical protein
MYAPAAGKKIKSDCEYESRRAKTPYMYICERALANPLLFTAASELLQPRDFAPRALCKCENKGRDSPRGGGGGRKGVSESGGRRASASRVAQILCRRTTKRH